MVKTGIFRAGLTGISTLSNMNTFKKGLLAHKNVLLKLLKTLFETVQENRHFRKPKFAFAICALVQFTFIVQSRSN